MVIIDVGLQQIETDDILPKGGGEEKLKASSLKLDFCQTRHES